MTPAAFMQALSHPDRLYIDFIMKPLVANLSPDANVSSLDDLAVIAGFDDFRSYHSCRHRQWLFESIPSALAKAKLVHNDKASGQQSLF